MKTTQQQGNLTSLHTYFKNYFYFSKFNVLCLRVLVAVEWPIQTGVPNKLHEVFPNSALADDCAERIPALGNGNKGGPLFWRSHNLYKSQLTQRFENSCKHGESALKIVLYLGSFPGRTYKSILIIRRLSNGWHD